MGDVIQIRDHQSRRQREQAEAALCEAMTLEQQAIEIMNIALMGEPTMIGMEPIIHINVYDTAPSEYCADKDAS